MRMDENGMYTFRDNKGNEVKLPGSGTLDDLAERGVTGIYLDVGEDPRLNDLFRCAPDRSIGKVVGALEDLQVLNTEYLPGTRVAVSPDAASWSKDPADAIRGGSGTVRELNLNYGPGRVDFPRILVELDKAPVVEGSTYLYGRLWWMRRSEIKTLLTENGSKIDKGDEACTE